jgi:hypothetical protein
MYVYCQKKIISLYLCCYFKEQNVSIIYISHFIMFLGIKTWHFQYCISHYTVVMQCYK